MKISRAVLPLLLAACMLVSLAGCAGSGTKVYVQSVASLSGASAITANDRFAGMVVSEKVTEIKRDADKTVAELKVKAGDDVKQGQALFSYDTDQLKLTLDKQKLELEQLDASIENYKEQIEELEQERANAGSGSQLSYTVQIQTLQVELKEAELNRKAKQTEVDQSAAILENAVVTSPIDGRIQTINESGTDRYGNPVPYITIQQAGSFRIQGTIGELQRGGLVAGTRMKIVSRTDESQVWYGTVTLVDYENPSQGNGDMAMYYGGMETDSMTSSSKYPFYVELEKPEGLLLGQHVYLCVDTGETDNTGVQIASSFLCYTDSGDAYVWAEKNGKLEKRTVTLGDYHDMTDTYTVLDGLTEADFIAFPDAELCHEGAPTTHEEPQNDGQDAIEPADAGMPVDAEMPVEVG